MSKIPIVVDYVVSATVIKGIREQAEAMLKWADKMQDLLDKAVAVKKKKKEDCGAWPT